MGNNAKEILRAHLRVSKEIVLQTQGYLDQTELTYPQRIALMILDGDGPMPISDLAAAMGSANSTISGVVDRLERLGLAQRIRSEQDRRKIYVSVTDRFLQQKEQSEAKANHSFSQGIQSLSDEEQKEILNALQLLAETLEKEQKERS